MEVKYENMCLLCQASRGMLQNGPMCFWRDVWLSSPCWSI